jgi:hypothetical protein
MKNYLTLAAFLGAIAFLSVSYLAQAQSEAITPPDASVSAPAPDAAPAPADGMTGEVTGFAKDLAECESLASAATTEGATPSAEEKAATTKKCLMDKGHTEEEIAKEEAKKQSESGADASAPTSDAPVPAPAE